MAAEPSKTGGQFSEISIELTKKLSSSDKKQNGIYFTPNGIIKKTYAFLKKFSERKGVHFTHVLEPSCGSCEFVNFLDEKLDDRAVIQGVELNKTIYNKTKSLSFKHDVSIVNSDFLEFDTKGTKYDLIIGNPPYFVMKAKDVSSDYKQYFEGRPNIYILFIIKCLGLLKKNGVLAFVLPNNFNNCLYYNKLRGYIYKNYKILEIINCSGDDYIETQQETCVLIVQNKIDKSGYNSKFSIEIGGDARIFNTKKNIKTIRSLYADSTTLDAMGFDVTVGTVVWNQVKPLLTDDEEMTRLIYSSDIVDGKVSMKKYKNEQKKNYIDKEGTSDPVLVINRGYGKGKYVFKYCIIDVNYKYLIENHLICIKPKERNGLSRRKIIKKYKQITKSFEDDRTDAFIGVYFGNNAINTTELKKILPIYLIE